MRTLFWSNAPWTNTGYGNQTKLFAPRINALGYPTAVFAMYGLRGGVVEWNGQKVYPLLFESHGNDAVTSHVEAWEADVVISLLDVSMVMPQALADVAWCPWFPIDGEPIRPNELAALRRALQPIVFSRFAERMAKDAGLDVAYVPHGVDTRVFQPGNQSAARESLGFPADRFMVGIVAANKGVPSRKAFPEQLRAFRLFKERHDDALLYIHTHRGREMQGLNLAALCESVGLAPGRDVRFVGQYPNAAGMVTDQDMAHIYQSMDVLLNVSWGEGFGIPIVEAQACGVPVIVGDWTAMPELCFAGWKVPKAEAQAVWTRFETWQWSALPGAIVECLEMAYAARGAGVLADQAVLGAQDYDADVVTERYWRPVLADIETMVGSGGKMQLVRLG